MTGTFASSAPEGSASTARVLIVDDEPANTTILERVLRQAGYVELSITNDSRKAVSLYEEFRPDIVLLDLHMPNVDGYEILGQLADPLRQGIRPPVVVLTADATRVARERALHLGAADFLTKPLDHLEVLLRIRSHLATRFLELAMLEQNADLEGIVAERTASLRETLAHLQETTDHRRRLTAALLTAQEAERTRIAADIHDGPVQALVALAMELELVARRAEDAARADLVPLRGEVAAVLEDLRTMIFQLAPASLTESGLMAGLEETIERLRTTHGPSIDLVAKLPREPSQAARALLYRIAREALVNAVRHGKPRRIVVTVAEHGDGFEMEVRDDGRGFELPADGSLPHAPGHFGLASMQERAELAGGWWRITSGIGDGTIVTAWVPEDSMTPSGGEGGGGNVMAEHG